MVYYRPAGGASDASSMYLRRVMPSARLLLADVAAQFTGTRPTQERVQLHRPPPRTLPSYLLSCPTPVPERRVNGVTHV